MKFRLWIRWAWLQIGLTYYCVVRDYWWLRIKLWYLWQWGWVLVQMAWISMRILVVDVLLRIRGEE